LLILRVIELKLRFSKLGTNYLVYWMTGLFLLVQLLKVFWVDSCECGVRNVWKTWNHKTTVDCPGVLADKPARASLASAHHQASFITASCQQSGDWLVVLLIASCEAVRVVATLQLGLDLCVFCITVNVAH